MWQYSFYLLMTKKRELLATSSGIRDMNTAKLHIMQIIPVFLSSTGRKSTATSGPGLNNKVLRYLSEHPIPEQPMILAAIFAALNMGWSGMGCSLRYLKTLLFRPGPEVAVLFLPVNDEKTGIICVICSWQYLFL